MGLESHSSWSLFLTSFTYPTVFEIYPRSYVNISFLFCYAVLKHKIWELGAREGFWTWKEVSVIALGPLLWGVRCKLPSVFPPKSPLWSMTCQSSAGSICCLMSQQSTGSSFEMGVGWRQVVLGKIVHCSVGFFGLGFLGCFFFLVVVVFLPFALWSVLSLFDLLSSPSSLFWKMFKSGFTSTSGCLYIFKYLCLKLSEISFSLSS